MDEWLFISLAKAKAEARPVSGDRLDEAKLRTLTKADTAAALDLDVVAEKPGFRGAAAFVGAVLVNAAILSAIDGSALAARTPRGEVIVAQLEPVDARPIGTGAYGSAVTHVH